MFEKVCVEFVLSYQRIDNTGALCFDVSKTDVLQYACSNCLILWCAECSTQTAVGAMVYLCNSASKIRNL